jgi:putative FmdB family regulatory protein
MPLYEYRCDTCEHQFEALQKMSDEPLLHCPACDDAALRKLVSAAGFRLKGDGWYETDFKKTGNKRNLAESETKSSSKPDSAT